MSTIKDHSRASGESIRGLHAGRRRRDASSHWRDRQRQIRGRDAANCRAGRRRRSSEVRVAKLRVQLPHVWSRHAGRSDGRHAERRAIRDPAPLRHPLVTATATVSMALGIGLNSVLFMYLDASSTGRCRCPTPTASWRSAPPAPMSAIAACRIPTTATCASGCRRSTASWRTAASATASRARATMPASARRHARQRQFLQCPRRHAGGRTAVRGRRGAAGQDAVVVLSHDFWRSTLGGDPNRRRRRGLDQRPAAHRRRCRRGDVYRMDAIVRPAFYVPASLGARLAAATAIR